MWPTGNNLTWKFRFTGWEMKQESVNPQNPARPAGMTCRKYDPIVTVREKA